MTHNGTQFIDVQLDFYSSVGKITKHPMLSSTVPETFIDVISEQKYIPKTNIAPENRLFASKRKKVLFQPSICDQKC